MSLCTKNFTIGVFGRIDYRDIRIGKNRIGGPIGRHLDKFLIGKNQKDCTLRRIWYVKERPETNIETPSVVYLMKKKEIDFYSFPFALDISVGEPVIEVTKPVGFSP